jgi:hypothetical protein
MVKIRLYSGLLLAVLLLVIPTTVLGQAATCSKLSLSLSRVSSLTGETGTHLKSQLLSADAKTCEARGVLRYYYTKNGTRGELKTIAEKSYAFDPKLNQSKIVVEPDYGFNLGLYGDTSKDTFVVYAEFLDGLISSKVLAKSAGLSIPKTAASSSKESSDTSSAGKTGTASSNPKDATGGFEPQTSDPSENPDLDPGSSAEPNEQLDNLSRFNTLPELIFGVLNYVFMFIGVIAVLMIIYGGFMMTVSAGNEERLGQGKKTIFWAIGGLVVTLMAFSIISIVQNILG